jgi:hypothetical protein
MGASRGRRAVAAILPRVRPRQPGARGQELAIVVVDAPGPAARPSSGSPSCGPPARRSARSAALREVPRAGAGLHGLLDLRPLQLAAASSAVDSLRTSATSQVRNLPVFCGEATPSHTVASPCCRRGSLTMRATNSSTEATCVGSTWTACLVAAVRCLSPLALNIRAARPSGSVGRGAVVDGDRVEHQALADAGDAEAALDPRVLALDLDDALVERGGRGLELGASRRSRG